MAAVHVWRVRLDVVGTEGLQEIQPTLSPDELQRAARFHFEKDRQRFVIVRGVLRDLLGCYLNLEPEKIEFTYNAYGKPSLAVQMNILDVQFNVSCSETIALIALTKKYQIGVDVEKIKIGLDLTTIVERFFSAYEVSVWRTIATDMQTSAFFDCWTRKEAYIKARGKGLSLPLDSFDVSFTPGTPARLLASRSNPQDEVHCILQALKPEVSYSGALAIVAQGGELSYSQYDYTQTLRGSLYRRQKKVGINSA